MRSYALAALEDIPLWHERDISHSSVERVIAPDATILLDFMLARFTGLMERLVVYPERMLANIAMTRGLIFSQMVLLKLVERGMSREKAYAVVQRSAMESWTKDLDFRGLLEADGEVTSFLTAADLDAVFRVENFLGQIDFIYERVFGERS
jgi:adenylosuccinate lyase